LSTTEQVGDHSAKTTYTYKPKACHVSGRPWGKNGRSKFGVRMGIYLVDNDGSPIDAYDL
jgi:hypothetical protein